MAAYVQGMLSRLRKLFSSTANEPTQSKLKSTASTVQYQYRIDDDSSATLLLPDGRKLGYAQYGLLTGQRTMFYCHGWPGSRLEAAMFDAIALRLELRIIAVERPGFGWSSPHPDRTLLDHAKDIESLANHLDLKSYGVLGISGGGPYALACAYALPADKLKGVSIVCGLGPPDMGYAGMDWMHWAGFTFGNRYMPGLMRWWFSRQPTWRPGLSDEERLELVVQEAVKNKSKSHPKDVIFFTDVDLMRLLTRGAREAVCQGFDGMVLDGKLINSDFGFRIEDIPKDLPVYLWYGTLDTSVPLHHGEKIATRLGANAHLRKVEETHASISLLRRDEFLEGLVKHL